MQLTPFGQAIFTGPLMWVLVLAPFAMVLFLSFRINSMSVSAAQLTFWGYAALMGVSLRFAVGLVYTHDSIAPGVPDHRRHLRRHEPLRLHDEA